MFTTLSFLSISMSICVPSILSSPFSDHDDCDVTTPEMPRACFICGMCRKHTPSKAKPRQLLTDGDVTLYLQKFSSISFLPPTNLKKNRQKGSTSLKYVFRLLSPKKERNVLRSRWQRAHLTSWRNYRYPRFSIVAIFLFA